LLCFTFSFREQFHQIPTPHDLAQLKTVYTHLLQKNQLSGSETESKYSEAFLTTDEDFLSLCQLLSQHRTFGLITTVSILGSTLTQEIIKAISLTGIPGYNVFLFEGNSFSVKAIPIPMNK
jgi:hypothetical protein